MADVTISELTQAAPTRSALVPFSNGASTLCTTVSSILSTGRTVSTLAPSVAGSEGDIWYQY
jgi:hypothetical protein